jgi:hypothetical protein
MTATQETPSDAVLRRIKHLLNKTVENGCTEGEALAALEKAQELLLNHNLSMGDVDAASKAEYARSGEKVGEERVRSEQKYIPFWMLYLGQHIAKHNFCRTLLHNQRDLGFIGTATNVQASILMFNFIASQVVRLSRESHRERPRYIAAATWTKGFNEGLVHRVGERLRQLRAEQQAANVKVTALVVVSDKAVGEYIRTQYPRLHNIRGGGQPNFSAHQAGYAQGDRVNLTPSQQVGGGPRRLTGGR